MVYPSITSVNLSEGFQEVPIYLDTVTSGFFIIMLLLTIYIVFVTGFYFSKRDLLGGFAVGGFAVALMAILFRVSGMLQGETGTLVLSVCIVAAVAGMAGLFVKKREP